MTMTAPDSPSTSYDVGYGKPPRHTQFQKGQSGNPGGRPRRDKSHDVRRLKAMTLREAYRGVIIGEGGVPVPAIQAVLRSQIKLAINGDFRAQRALLTAVEGFENEDEEAAALDEYADRVIEQANDELAERSVEKLEEREDAASTAVKKMSYAEAADRVMFLLRMGKYAVKSETGGETGAPGNETVAEDRTERDAETNAGAQQQPAASAPPPGSDMPLAPPSAASAPSSAAAPRHARHRVQKPAPSPAAILKVAGRSILRDSRIACEVIHDMDESLHFPSFGSESRLRHLSGLPERTRRQYRHCGFRPVGLRDVFHAEHFLPVLPTRS